MLISTQRYESDYSCDRLQMISNRIDALQESQTGVSRYRRVHQLPGIVGDIFAERVLAAGRCRRQHLRRH